MSVEEARERLLYTVQCDCGNTFPPPRSDVDCLILEVQAAMPCYQQEPGRGYEKDCLAINANPKYACLSCVARAVLQSAR